MSTIVHSHVHRKCQYKEAKVPKGKKTPTNCSH